MIGAEFVKQFILVLLYLVIIITAIRLGITFRKNKNLKDANKSEKQE